MKDTFRAVLRLLVTAALVFGTWLGAKKMEAFLKVPPISQLSLDIRQFPLKLGGWQGDEVRLEGEDARLHKEIFMNTGAKVTVDRLYHDSVGDPLKLYIATFDDPDAGVYHAPTNCYTSHGWRLLKEAKVDLPVRGGPDQRVSLSTWEKKNETILVVFWYRMGDYTLFERWDMGRVRLAMSGLKTWPPLVKVLLEMPTPHENDFQSQERIKDVAARIQKWLNQSNAGEKTEGAGK
jgi:EpsI family protein